MHTAGDKGASRVLAIDIAGAFDRVSHTGVLPRDKARVYGISGDLHRWLQDYLCNPRRMHISGQTCYRAVSWAPPYSWPTSMTSKTTSQSAPTSPHSPTMQPFTPKSQLSLVFLTTLEYSRLLLTSYPVGARIVKCSSSQPNPRPLQFLTIVVTGQYIVFNGTPVEEQPSIKVLGVTFDQQLKFNQHIRTVVVRAT